MSEVSESKALAVSRSKKRPLVARVEEKDRFGIALVKWEKIIRALECGTSLQVALARYGALRREFMRCTECDPDRTARYKAAKALWAGTLVDKALDYTERFAAQDVAGASSYARTALAVAAKLDPAQWADKPQAAAGVTLIVNTNLGEVIESVPDLDGSLSIAGPVKTVPATRGRRAPKGT